MSNLQELLAQKASLDEQIAQAKASAFDGVVASIAAQCDENAFTLDEVAAALLTEFKKRARRKRNSARRSPPKPAKFRHIPTGVEWNGVGRTPDWMKEEGNVREL